MSRETVITLQIIGALLVVSAVAMFFVPAFDIWPWVLMFGSVGVGLCIGPGLAPYRSRQGGGGEHDAARQGEGE